MTLDAGLITISHSGFTETLSPSNTRDSNQQNQTGITYRAILPTGTLTGGEYQVSATGLSTDGTNQVGAFTNTLQIPPPISITTNLQPKTHLIDTSVSWTGGDSRSVVTGKVVRSPGTPQAYEQTVTVLASDGHLGFGAATARFPPPFKPGEAIELVITQEPVPSPGPPFSGPIFAVPGLSLGAEHAWRFTFDFRDLNIN